MSASGGACPACHAAVVPGSAFCTRCGGALPAVTLIAPVLDTGQSWGGARRRGRERAEPPAVPDAASPAGDGRPPGAALAYADPGPAALARPAVALGPLGPAFDGVTPAGVGRRLAALMLDIVAVAVVAGPVLWLTGSPVYAALAAVELAVGLVVWEARSGKTIGNALLGLRTAKEETPYAPGLARAVGRALVLGAGCLVAGLGQWLMVAAAAFDRTGRRQGWHDKAAGTVVVDVRAMRVEGADEAPQAARFAAAGHGAGDAVLVPPSVPAPEPAPESRVPVPPARAVPAPVAASYLLTLDTGETTTVSGPGIVGRKPQVPAGERCDHVIGVDDPGRSLSRTHLRFGVEHGRFWVEDMGSANGTFLVATDGTTLQVAPGERHAVPAGGYVRLGERTFTVRADS